jgi:hypothetical protein
MYWCVAKTGFEMFDALHAYGLGILLATAYRQPVELSEEGLAYRLSNQAQMIPTTTTALLDSALELPGTADLDALRDDWPLRSRSCYLLSIAVLDGLLTALFTIPGARTLSVSDLVSSQNYSVESATSSFNKVASAIANWKAFVERETQHEENWLSFILRDYTCSHLVSPLPAEATRRHDIRLSLMIDPSFSYSLRRPTSDGELTHKSNLTVHGTRFAPLLTYLGASRFLRAQRVAGSMVNVYVPLASNLKLTRKTAFPPLTYLNCSAGEAAVRYWLPLSSRKWRFSANWRGIAYQTLQTQKQQQSITLDRGFLDCTWLLKLPAAIRRKMVNGWLAELGQQGTADLDAKAQLTDVLLSHRMDSWIAHLRYRMYTTINSESDNISLYSIDEVRRLSAMMDASTNHPLRSIVERQEGTLRFGHALRQLGRYNAAILRDVIELLEAAQTPAQLNLALHLALQECELAKAKSPFISIPDDTDFTFLVDDVERHGVRIIASMLMLLSVLRYPRSDDSDGPEQPAEGRSDASDDLASEPSSEPTTFETLTFAEEGELEHEG